MSRPKSPQRIAMENRAGLRITQQMKRHRIAALLPQLEGCASDEARRLILHGIDARSKKLEMRVK